jgi:hypothetical protein
LHLTENVDIGSLVIADCADISNLNVADCADIGIFVVTDRVTIGSLVVTDSVATGSLNVADSVDNGNPQKQNPNVKWGLNLCHYWYSEYVFIEKVITSRECLCMYSLKQCY